METLRYITTAYILTILLVPVLTSAYSVPTHKAITQETLQAYEAIYGNVFTAAEERLIINGSDEEDHDTRPLNHFYDPISGKGLTVFKWFNLRKVTKGDASPSWATDTRAQADWSGIKLTSADTLFSNSTDYSWQRGVYEYVQNERGRGLATLGHTLHLLQDSSVPAHVRNDDHLTLEGAPIDPDPYETYTARFKQGTIRDIKVHTVDVPIYDSPDTYIKRLASFTNKNFLSKDTVFSEYSEPSEKKVGIRNGFAYHKLLGHKLVQADTEEGLFSDSVYFKFGSEDVEQSYWQSLSYEAVRHGVGLIDLFMHAAESEAETSALKIKNKSRGELAFEETTRKLGFAAIKTFYGSSLDEADVQELNTEVYASRASQFRPPVVQNKSPVPPHQKTFPKQYEATIIKGAQNGTNEIITPEQQVQQVETQAPDYQQMGAALISIEQLMALLLKRFDEQYGKCAGIDLSILKSSTCAKPFGPGGYAYGGGGSGVVASSGDEEVACVPTPENDFCDSAPPSGGGGPIMEF